MKPLITALILSCLVCTAALGTELPELQGFLSTLPAAQDRSLKFSEYRHSSLFENALILEGELRIDEQGALVKQLDSPVQEKMVIGTREFSLETPDKSYKTKLSRSPFLKTLSAGLRGLLNRDAEAILSVFKVQLTQTDIDWMMILKPRARSLRKYVERLEVSGCPGQVKMVSVHTGPDEWQEMIFQEGGEACAR